MRIRRNQLICSVLTLWVLVGASCSSKPNNLVVLEEDDCASPPEKGMIEVLEDKITAEQDGADLQVSIPLKSIAAHPVSGTIVGQLETMSEEVVASGISTFSLDSEGQEGIVVSIFGIPEGMSLSETAEYVVKYTVTYPGWESDGKRSLFSLTKQTRGMLTGPSTLVPGTTNHFRIAAQAPNTGEALQGAQVSIALSDPQGGEALSEVLFHGTTDERGICEASFEVPDNLPSSVLVVAEIDDGSTVQTISAPASVQSGTQILLTTDKPIYQPGQTIHLRSLALARPLRTPVAGQEAVFEVLDPKGNKVFKEIIDTSSHGIASAQFQLASEVNQGTYSIRCTIDGSTFEKTITVERYALPKFGVSVTTDADYYHPGDTLSGSISASYFFGMDLENAQVSVSAKKFDVDFNTFATVSGQTDSEGIFDFQFSLPTYFVGQPLDDGNAFVLLNFTIEDTAGQTRVVEVTRPIVNDPILMNLVPESGTVVPGIENIFYLLTTSPSGSPIPAQSIVSIGSQDFHVSSGTNGIATVGVTIPPSASTSTLSVSVASQDTSGHTGQRTFNFTAGAGNSFLLLRTDQPVYEVGDTAQIQVHCPAVSAGFQDRVFVDVIKDGRAVFMKTLDVIDGIASMDLEITNELTGGAAIEAYYISNSSLIIRDRKLFYVGAADQLNIAVQTDQSTYLPAQDAQISFTVTDSAGLPVSAAIGTQIVDEAVYALMDFKPGLERMFYSLEEQIMDPSYEIHGYDMNNVANTTTDSSPEEEDIAEILLAAASEGSEGTFFEGLDEENSKAMLLAQQAVDSKMIPIQKRLTELDDRNVFSSSTDALEYLKATANCWKDPWGTPFSASRSGVVFIMSTPGPDEIWNTEDDLAGYFEFSSENDPGGSDGDADSDTDADSDCDADTDVDGDTDSDTGAGGEDAVRVRSYFPETLYVNPALITGNDGTATITVPMADSITTWRLSALASSGAGQLGSTEEGIAVFQDFFVDIDFPATLTQDDEIAVPIAIYNYLPNAQTVTLTVQDEPWFDLLDLSSKSIIVQPGEVVGESFLIKVNDVGWHDFTVFGYGDSMSDAVARAVEVLPNGKKFEDSVSGRLDSQVNHTFNIPSTAIADASKILVKIYPGMLAHAIEGLDSMLSMPHGCFEQTSSSTYPNVLVLDYLIATGQITPEVEMKAREYINLGYQRLLTFECTGGGFEWFGNSPAHNILTAYGLLEFHDMSKVHPVDPAIITRTQDWLAAQQESDGHWEPSYGGIQEGAINAYSDDIARTTAYLTYALAKSEYQGYAKDAGIAWLKSHYGHFTDSYGLALFANALLANNPNDTMADQALQDLQSMKVVDGDKVYWTGSGQSTTYGSGDVMHIEATALVTSAMIKAGVYSSDVESAVNYLVSRKDSLGNWSTTQATVLTLNALLESLSFASQPGPATISVFAHGALEEVVNITAADSDVMRLIDLEDVTVTGDNQISLQISGSSSYTYQIVSRHYIPWTDMSLQSNQGTLDIDVQYDTTTLSVNDFVNVDVTVTNTTPGAVARMVIVDLGLPPGFSLVSNDLVASVSAGELQKFEKTNRQLILYIDHIAEGSPLSVSYQLQADYPVTVSSGSSGVQPYYSPADRSDVSPVELTVTD